MLKALLTIVATVALAFMAVSTASAASVAQRDFRLRADLSGNTLASGHADYRERTGRSSRLSVEIEDAAANTQYDVMVNGVFVSTITTNALGFADLNLRGTSVPVIVAGDTITVGTILSGVFQID